MPDTFVATEIIDEAGFHNLREDWEKLLKEDDQATFFQTWEFQYYTWKINEDSISPNLLTIRDEEGCLVGCAPLGQRKWHLGPLQIRILEFATGRYCDYSSFILKKDKRSQILETMAQWFQKNLTRWDVAIFQPIREDSIVLSQNDFLKKIDTRYSISQTGSAPFLTMNENWTTYEDILSKKRAKSIRYEIKNLFRKFKGAFEALSKEDEVRVAVNQLMDLHQKRMKVKQQVGAFANQKSREGFEALILDLARKDLLKIYTIRSEEKAIAAICTFDFRGTISFYQGGFDPEFSKLSPGKVIQALRITEAIKGGSKEYDFLDGDESYKTTWANGERKMYSLELSTGSWRAFIYTQFNKLRIKLSQSERARKIYLWMRQHKTSE